MSLHPPELARLLADLGRAGVELAPHPSDGERLRHRPATLPPDLSDRLRRHRAAVLGLLTNGYTPEAETDAAYIMGERLGVADELTMPTHPGSSAWLVAVGESMGCSCFLATDGVYCPHGETDGRDSSGDPGERSNALCNRQGCERGP